MVKGGAGTGGDTQGRIIHGWVAWVLVVVGVTDALCVIWTESLVLVMGPGYKQQK